MNSPIRSFLAGAALVAVVTLAAPVALGQGITIDLGKTEAGRYMNLVGNTSGSDGEISDMFFVAPEYAAQNKGTSMYFAIDDTFFYQLPAGWSVIVNVQYYDAPGVTINLVYDARDNHAGKEHPQSITTAGTNTWKAKSFTIDDAYFGNGLSHGADLKLVAAAGTMTINAVSVVPFEAYYDFGLVSDSLFVQWMDLYGGDSHIEFVTKEGEQCVTTVGTGQYLYVNVVDSFLSFGEPTTNVFLAVEYYDEDPPLSFRIQYDAIGGYNHHKPTPYVYGRGWNSFRTCTFEFSDALFANRQSPITDFRLCLPMPGLAINRIMIARLPKKPLPPTGNIANFTAHKALESPVMDGSLGEWSWLTPYAVLQQFADDSSRTDEFYRAWMLNRANVPIAEPGEMGVSDPGIPGNWDPGDLGGGVSMLWDDTNLYFAVSVKDNIVNATGNNWDNKDGFGFYIDASHHDADTGTTPAANRDDPRFTQGEHFFFFPADQAQPGTWCHSSFQTGEAMPGSVTRSVARTDSGYIIEGSVPLSLIADGLPWYPGIPGDRDNFSPLFAWMINDNDGIGASSGRVMCGGYSADDEFWGTLNMNPIPLVDHGIMIDLGVTNYENLLKQVETQPGGDGVTTPVERAGKTGVMLSSGYAYFDVDDSVFNAAKHPHLLVSVEYFDSAMANSRFRIQYDADTAAYVSMPYSYVGNSRSWKTAIFEITRARFEGRQNGHADFRIATSSSTRDVVINQVKVGIADLWIDLGDSAISHGIVETNLGGDGTRAPATVGGVNCMGNGMAFTATARYLYHAVSDSLIYSGNHQKLLVTVEYYDTTSSGGVGMNYDGMNNVWTAPPGNAYILGTNQWKLHTFSLPDANFAHRENGHSDFRIAGMGEGTTFINRILIGSLDGLTTSVQSYQPPLYTFRLEQNYPNPFNPTTVVSSQYSVSSHVKLAVYDLLGREVKVLVDGWRAAGRYQDTFDASGLSSGVYICRLRAGGCVQTRAMVLVR